MNTMQLEAAAKLRDDRAAMLTSLSRGINHLHTGLVQWQQLMVAVQPDGEIGSVWADAETSNGILLAQLGDTVDVLISAIMQVIAAGKAFQAAGEEADPPFSPLPNLPQ